MPFECSHGGSAEERWAEAAGAPMHLTVCVCCGGPARAADHGYKAESLDGPGPKLDVNDTCRLCWQG